MQEFQIKRTNLNTYRTVMISAMKEFFNAEPKEHDGRFEISYGALQCLSISIGNNGKSIIVNTESRTDVSDEVILDTNRRFRQYLEKVTGYTTKERIKKSKKLVEG